MLNAQYGVSLVNCLLNSTLNLKVGGSNLVLFNILNGKRVKSMPGILVKFENNSLCKGFSTLCQHQKNFIFSPLPNKFNQTPHVFFYSQGELILQDRFQLRLLLY
jgi:hypothetical protein